MLTRDQLGTIAGNPTTKAAKANIASIIVALNGYGTSAGLDKPHRLAHYIAQLAHESGQFRFDHEIWGPTRAQKGYDTRTDLGNTPALDGDGKKFEGRTGIMVTGKANYAAFRDWCVAQGYQPPDFVATPEAIDTDPWEGLAPIWFWTVHGLNGLADRNDIEMITRRINGGLNGLAGRLKLYTRAALVLAGYGPTDIAAFQTAAQKAGTYPFTARVDGIDGPKTRAALQMTLAAESPSTSVAPGPVTQPKPVAVEPHNATKLTNTRIASLVGVASPAVGAFGNYDLATKLIFVAIGVAAVGFLLWRGEVIAARVKAILASFDRAAS